MEFSKLNMLIKLGREFGHEQIRDAGFSDTEHAICTFLCFHDQVSQDMIANALLLDKTTVAKALSVITSYSIHYTKLYDEVGERNEPTKTVRQMSIHTPESGKITTVNFLMKETDPRLTLIFCNTRHRVKTVTSKLNAAGLTTACIHGDLSLV